MTTNAFSFKQPQNVKPFQVNIDPAKIEAIRQRVASAKLPKQMPPKPGSDTDWESGMNLQWLESFRQTWANQYEWESAQEWLNKYPQYQATVGEDTVHFYHVVGEGNNPRPLMLIHGWPGSVCEFLNIIDTLTHPSKFGGKTNDAFSLVIPSLPGFGFSSMPTTAINATSTAALFNSLMTEVIGYDQYFAQGGDFGGGVAVQLAYHFPMNVRAIHLNFTPWFPIDLETMSREEKQWQIESDAFAAREFDYMKLQANKPMTPAVALVDSPLGTAAWIAEKFWAWTDNRNDLDAVIPRDLLITNVLLYLVNDNGIDGSFWYYRGFRDEMNWSFFTGYVEVPTAIAAFPKEYPIARPSKETALRGYNVVHYTKMPSGGHFAALEEPVLLVEDIQSAFADL